MHEEIKNWIHALQKVDHVNDYEQQVEKMKCMLMEMGVDPDILKEINERSKFV